MKKFAFAIAVLALAPSAQVMAQATPLSRTIPITFTGVVANDVTQSIMIRQPNGTLAPYTGPKPDYPYKKGEPVTITFNAEVPIARAFAAGQPYAGQLAADGTYRFSVRTPNIPDQPRQPDFGNSTVTTVSGPIGTATSSTPLPTLPGDPPNTVMTMIYNANTDSYSLDFTNGRPFNATYFNNTPGYVYDSKAGTLTPCAGTTSTTCTPGFANNQSPRDIFLTGNETQVSVNVPVFDALGAATKDFFTLLFSGSWNLPSFGSGGSSGGPTNVPEPSMMLLFGGGTAALLRKRRRKALAAS